MKVVTLDVSDVLQYMAANIRKFFRLSLLDKQLFLEAFFLLAFFRAAIAIRPFQKITTTLQKQQAQEPQAPLSATCRESVIAISRGVQRAAIHTPWESACLVQSLAAHRMLKRRNLPGYFCLGVKKNTDPRSTEVMKAHSWTRCGNITVTGAVGIDEFTIVAVYKWES